MAETKPNFKLHQKELYISTPLLNNIISQSTVKKAIIEETTSELWYETYNGPGTMKFKNSMKFQGNLHYGIINNEDPENPCTLIFPGGTKYVGTVINNDNWTRTILVQKWFYIFRRCIKWSKTW